MGNFERSGAGLQFNGVSHQLMTAEAARTFEALSERDQARLLSLPLHDQEGAMRTMWTEARDFESLAGHDATRALYSLAEFYQNEPHKTEVTYYFPLHDAEEYHKLLESNFRRGLGPLVRKMTGFEGCNLPDITDLEPEELSNYSFSCQAPGLTIGNYLDLTCDGRLSMSRYDFNKSV